MRIPLRWIQEYIDLPTDDPKTLADVLSMIGNKVESYELLEPEWSKVVVGEVLEITAHPDADKVRVCSVDTGSGPSQIICGAWNFDAGARVPVALPGAVLPDGFEIGQRSIRGVDSNGMICSESELGLGDDHDGILVLDGTPELGTDFTDIVELPDVVFEFEITPNRPDSMSVIGIVRDLAAYYDIPFRTPDLTVDTIPGATSISVRIEDPVGCRRFTGREIRDVAVGRSPLWMRHRLAKAGVRSISNVVDVTNYVMVEMGHPLHAFDADSIADDHLTVRRAAAGEELVTLDHEIRKLDPEDLIIYDGAGPTSMSGTMGGARSEVSGETTRVFMEAASWDPPTIMYMSKRHGLRSEASTRFERGVDPNLADEANLRASALVASLGGGVVLEGAVDEVGVSTEPVTIALTTSDVERLLGPGFESEYVGSILQRLGMDVSGHGPLMVTVPTFRPDVTRPADLVEEVARIHGFDKFGATVPHGSSGGLTIEQRRMRKLMDVLAGAGLQQAVTLPFVGEGDLGHIGLMAVSESFLRVKNPLSEEESLLRPQLLPGLLNVARYNASHGLKRLAVFEVGRVFSTEPYEYDHRLPSQPERLGWLIFGRTGISGIGSSPQESDGPLSIALARHLLRSLGIADREFVISPGSSPGYHPGRSAQIALHGTVIGHVGELAPSVASAFDIPGRVAVAELDTAPLLAPARVRTATAPSVFPHVEFDLSFLVPGDVAVGPMKEAVDGAAGDLLESSVVFDEFKGTDMADGTRAVAIRYRLRSSDQTLTNESVAPIRDEMIAAGEAAGARLRGAE
ncbi:MAG TPA: phenylalanine--tRNA ligase subunit beta [Acidimicrobiia bacterium]